LVVAFIFHFVNILLTPIDFSFDDSRISKLIDFSVGDSRISKLIVYYPDRLFLCCYIVIYAQSFFFCRLLCSYARNFFQGFSEGFKIRNSSGLQMGMLNMTGNDGTTDHDVNLYHIMMASSVTLKEGHGMEGIFSVTRTVHNLDKNYVRNYLYQLPLGHQSSILPAELASSI